MPIDFPGRHRQLLEEHGRLRLANPDVMAGLAGMHKAAMADGALTARTKELMALAISVAGRCDGSIAHHTHDALAAGATPEQIEEAVGVAIVMGGRPAAINGSDALVAMAQFLAERGG